MATRNGSAKWTGDLKTGSGELTVGEGAWTSAYSGRSRFAGVLPGFEDSEGTNPEELLAAAHAACFSMALSLGLSDAGHPPSSISTTARVHCASWAVRRPSSRSTSPPRRMYLGWS